MPRVQSGIGRAECLVSSARAYVYDALAVQWDRLDAGAPLTKKERADVWLSRMNAFQTAREVARLLYDLVGASAIYSRRAPFDRFLRDSEKMCQHLVAQEKGHELVGAMLLDPEGTSAHPML
jgi:alkylation response protein AidB-like acyl-CoA dehydrogenase